VVLLPGFPGGMENATITFNGETTGQGNVAFGLNAHELGHHWFGDWVTMHTYDDVWVKEGMATVLESEAQRGLRDKAALGRMFGRDKTFDPADAVVDPSLHSLDKYTSGPYQRAAWLITQIRATVGENAFWASLRQVLADHALDSVTGEQFIRAFPLDEPTVTKLLAALTTKDTVSIAVTSAAVAGGTSVTLTASDPASTLIAPIGVTVVDASGAATPHTLAAGALTVTVPTGGYLAPDEADVHPYWPGSFTIANADYGKLRTVMRPASATAITAWTARSAAQQERELADTGLPTQVGADVTAFYPALDSTVAQRSTVFAGCFALGQLTGTAATEMQQALAPLVATPADPRFTTSYARCGTALPAALATELSQLVDSVTPATAGRLDYLLSFDYGDAGFAPISRLATTAPSLALRDRAISRLAAQAIGSYTPVAAADVPAWQQFFRDRLAGVTSQTRLISVWNGVLGLADVSALPLVAPLMHSVPMSDAVQLSIVCDAYALAQSTTPSAWPAFQQATMPWDGFPADVAAALADPTKCNAARRVDARAPVRSKVAREALRE
jgi:aminopeptidase N